MTQLFKNIILFKSFSSITEADFCWFFALSVWNYSDACSTSTVHGLDFVVRASVPTAFPESIWFLGKTTTALEITASSKKAGIALANKRET